MSNDPVNNVDPDGAYSKVGAWWRNGFSMDGVYESGGEWGYNTSSFDGEGGVTIDAHFGVNQDKWKETAPKVLEERSQFWDFLMGSRSAEVNGQLQDISYDGYAKGYLSVTGTVDLPVGPGGAVKIIKNVPNARKVIVIGENMAERVIPYAKKIGAKWFKPRGKNPANWMRNQINWIRKQLRDPHTEIIDIGPKGTTPASKYYMKELEEVGKWLGQ